MTIKHADRIIVVQNGEIIEQGAHDDLLHQDGAYKNLILAQTVWNKASRHSDGTRKKASRH
ncbi:hypothetical protein [Peribacillus frigoritolerans]|uniref:hypothetical protein n=1 Tax=Peribacillus frigoritolerans TaxID=450367 RepID=UPI0024B4B0EC|nr:hypothetical protein [Peribacillus frigoritolerans]